VSFWKQSSPEPDSDQPKYWIFISYSHQDKSWAEWFHNKVENYRVPRSLVGKPSRDGVVPRRLFPCFRDREELPVSADLGARLKTCLTRSRYLIVICSPRAAKSRWVNEEIRQFKSLEREERVLCFIVDGKPNAGDKPELADDECFPAAVKYKVGADGLLTDQRTEPLAADARREADGARNAVLKAIAGVLGVNFDDLRRRDQSRRRRRIAQLTVAALLLATGVADIYYEEERSKQTQAKEKQIERYIGLGRKEMEGGSLSRALVYLAEARRTGASDDALLELVGDAAKALVPVPLKLTGHSEWVPFAVFSADGQRLLTAGWDKTVRLWDLASKQGRPLITERKGRMACANFSPDERRIATASWSSVAKLWNEDGTAVCKLEGHRGRVNFVAFSPDATRVVTASDDETAKIWDVSGKVLLSLDEHEEAVKSAEFSPTGERVVTASLDKTARIWDAQTGKCLLVLEGSDGHRDGVNVARFSSDGKRIVTASFDRTAKIWDASSGRCLQTISGHRNRLNFAAFSPDGKRVVTASDDGSAVVWNASSGKMELCLEGHAGKVLCAAFSPDGSRIVTTGSDKTVRIWMAKTEPRSIDEIVQAVPELVPWHLVNGQIEPKTESNLSLTALAPSR
jgi:WD40 repeat protein